MAAGNDRILTTHAGSLPRPNELADTVILGVIDVKTSYIEHPRVVADRLVNLGKVIGKER